MVEGDALEKEPLQHVELGQTLQGLELVKMEVNDVIGGGSFRRIQKVQGDLVG